MIDIIHFSSSPPLLAVSFVVVSDSYRYCILVVYKCDSSHTTHDEQERITERTIVVVKQYSVSQYRMGNGSERKRPHRLLLRLQVKV